MLSFQFLLLSFGGFRALTQYALYHDFIAEQLCIKKDIENNNCQGRCHMLKQIEQAEQQEESLQFSFKLYELLVIDAVEVKLTSQNIQNQVLLFKPVSEGAVKLFQGNIFHPPRA